MACNCHSTATNKNFLRCTEIDLAIISRIFGTESFMTDVTVNTYKCMVPTFCIIYYYGNSHFMFMTLFTSN